MMPPLILKNNPLFPARRSIFIFTDNDGNGPDFRKTVVRHLWEANVTVNAVVVASAETIASRLGPLGSERLYSPDDVNPLADETGGEVINGAQPGAPFPEMLRGMRQAYTLYYTLHRQQAR